MSNQAFTPKNAGISTDKSLFKVGNRNIKAMFEIYSKLTTKTPELSHWHRSGVFIVNFEQILQLFPLSTLNK